MTTKNRPLIMHAFSSRKLESKKPAPFLPLPSLYPLPDVSSHVRLLGELTINNMSEVLIQKVATAIRCNCGHLWLTTSKSKYPTCPRCHIPISRKKHAVILQSEITRNQNKKAESEARTPDSAGHGLNYNGTFQDPNR